MISIICPVYKATKYLSRCVGSVLQQTFTDFELILVDDGSPDKSGELCDKYAKKDSRIKVIHKENGGASSARNAGLDIAQGKYITFIDSDDWVAKNYLETLIEPMKKHNVQLVIGSYEKRGHSCNLKRLKTRLINFSELSDEEKSLCYMQNLYSPWTKLFQLSIIRQHNLRFQLDIHYGEDTLFVRSYLRFCESIYTREEIIYFYNTFNESSLTKRVDIRKRQWTLMVIEDFYNMLRDVGIGEVLRNQLISSQTFDYFYHHVEEQIQRAQKQKAKEEIKKTLEVYQKYLSLDLAWAKKEDSYFTLRQAILNKNIDEIYNISNNIFKVKKIRKLISNIKWKILSPYLERKRDGLNKYRYLDK